MCVFLIQYYTNLYWYQDQYDQVMIFYVDIRGNKVKVIIIKMKR